MRRRWIAVSVALLVIVLTGCKKAPRPASYGGEISGTVIFHGEPLPSGTITFVLDNPTDPDTRPGIASIDTNGSFRVGNANPDKPSGVPPGKYRVLVIRMQARPEGPAKPPIAVLTTPEQFAELETTPLSIEIHRGENRVRVDLDQAIVEPLAVATQGLPPSSR